MRKIQKRFGRKTQLLLLACLFAITTAQTQTDRRDPLKSVIGIRTQIPNAARTAQLLGNERAGSGIVIDKQGLVVTVGYVILEAETVEIIDVDGQIIPAAVIGYHAETGFGLIRSLLDLKAAPAILGQSAQVSIKDSVTAMSRSQKPVAQNVVVASRRTFAGYWEYLLKNAIFTAPAVPSFAGAALINPAGELIGVGSLVVENVSQVKGKNLRGNLFIPIDRLSPIIEDLVKNGRPSGPQRPWLGVLVNEQYGRVMVVSTSPSSPAQKVGIERGDILLEIAGHPIDTLETFYQNLWKLGSAGVEVPITLLHKNTIQKMKVMSGNRYHHYRYSHLH